MAVPKIRKPIFAVLIIALIAAAAMLVWRWMHHRPVGNEIVLQGDVDIRQVDLAFNAMERIAKVMVEEGNLESRWFIVPGIMGLLTLVVTILVTSLSVAREREQGTFDQLLVTPFRPVEILLGKALPGFVIGIGEATVIILATVFWFRVPLLGNVVTLYTGVVLFLFSVIGVGLMISSFSVTQQQGLLGAFLFVVPAVILSGFTTPIANMPRLVRDITLLNPMRYFMVVIRGVFLEGAPFSVLVDQFWPMAAIGLITLAMAASMFRKRLY
jgi:ABC-2 type transport system permease protein